MSNELKTQITIQGSNY